MRIVWGVAPFVLAMLIAWLVTSPAPPPQRFDLAWVSPLSAFVVQPKLGLRGEEPWMGTPMWTIPPRIEVHVQPTTISVFVSQLALPPLVARRGRDQEERLVTRLRTLRREAAFDGRADIRVIELADRAGWTGIGYVPPRAAIFDPPPPLEEL